MKILHVCSEVFPLLKTGGLADVAGALPQALNKLDTDNRLLVPGFPAFMQGVEQLKLVKEIKNKFGAATVKLYLGKLESVDTYVIDAPELYNRSGNPYLDANNQSYADNYLRFALLGWMAAQLANGWDEHWLPNVVHGHDWHAGLMPAYVRSIEEYTGKKLAKTILTVHNLAYQGVFPAHTFYELELPWHFFNMNGMEFYGQVSFLKAGLYFADKITTVSPSYALEIQTEEQGCGLSGLLHSRNHDLYGVLNGVDPKVWSPELDSGIAQNFTNKSMAGKAVCRQALQSYVGITQQTEKPIFAIVSRLTEQKGLHLVVEGIYEIINRGGQVVILGSGEHEIEAAFAHVASKHPESVAIQFGYDELHAHRIIAGSDVIMVPSRFEPCGLTQLYGMAYGTLPLVHSVGGLKDTVSDTSLENLVEECATGFVFNQFTVAGFITAVRRAFALYSRKTDWKKVQKYAMQQNFSWDVAADKYLTIYHH